MSLHLHVVLVIARASWLELVRRKDLAVAGMFLMGLLLLLGAARLVGFEHAAAGTLLLNLSLTVVTAMAQIMTLVMAARQFPEELEQRTLHPLLARPVRRAEVVLGKWAACALAGLAIFALMNACVLPLTPRMEDYHTATLAQHLLLQVPALTTIAALSLMLTLLWPKGIAVLVASLLTFGIGPVLRRLDGAWLGMLWPDPGRLNLILRYTDGIGPLPALDATLLLLSGFLWTLGLLWAAITLFNQRNL
jgi:ABC-type transport system involved in multi-copper enzyme maturation permease subunit